MRKRTVSDRYSAAAGLASAIGVTAKSYGIDIVPMCRALEIDPATFSDLTGRISLDRLCRLIESCALIADDEAFGLRIVDNFVPGSTGPFGYGLLMAPTPLDFFRFLGDHMPYAVETSWSKLTVDETGAEIACRYSPLIVKRDQFVDMNMGLIVDRLLGFPGLSVDMIDVGLERPKPRNTGIFREKLGKKVRFGRPTITLKIPADCLELRNPQSDIRLFKLMDLQCRSMHAPRQDPEEFLGSLREFILQRVADSTISLADAAAYFHISERTLQRRLAERGTSLNDVRDEVRKSLAEKLLAESELSASEIALRLGYSASSALTRSTLRWFGMTPRDYRKKAG